MKYFLEKKDALKILKDLQKGKTINPDDSLALASIRICLAGEMMGINFWGKEIEGAKSLFQISKDFKPSCLNNDLINENYEAFQICVNEAFEKYGTED